VVREALDLHDGDEVVFRVERKRAVVAKTPDFIELAGSVAVPAGKRGRRGMRSCGRRAGRVRRSGAERLSRHERPHPALDRRSAGHGRQGDRLLLADLVLAECVYVLESFYEVERERVAELLRAAMALPSIAVIDAPLLLRALELYEPYEVDRLDFAEAYLVASAEATGVGAVMSFDRGIDRVRTAERVEP
jgi:predicted nucleic-acid-binding protein